MKHRIVLSVICVFLLSGVPAAHALQTPEETVVPEAKNYFLAINNALLSNLALHLTNRYIGQQDFAKISMESIKNNLTGPWQWDRSMFLVNQLGHPYQGYTYYAAARANGLNAFESTLITALGSYTWEVFAERTTAAVNDFIVTTTGGVFLGEVLHRIYLETYTSNQVLASIVSPMDAFNDLVSGKKQKPTDSKINSCSLYLTSGYIGTKHYLNGGEYNKDNLNTAAMGAGIALSYGDPFVSSTDRIFSHFDFNLHASVGYDWYDLVLLADGALYSVTPRPKARSITSYGLNLHHDIFTSSLLDFSGESLTFTLQNERHFTGNSVLNIKAHTGALLLGSSTFYKNELDSTETSAAKHDYGVGGTAKLRINWIFPQGGTIGLHGAAYLMSVLPGTVEDSEGRVMFSSSSIEYTHPLNQHVSVGMANSFTWKKSDRYDLPDHEKFICSARVFMEYEL